ncbi:MAG: SMC-Scp complex subunit ScpB [Micavibrio aeruginosavorus]|uniref:SMC-Scp complex subunit ScpB n=1 Tax=Micavibrio aeruginosavorus TaxID=349221 RepID=A0A7T5R4G0_9BACT|nr:MAG: SMC-Scp complex subunit ScpB [Micavibrio aeruginosavorus]
MINQTFIEDEDEEAVSAVTGESVVQATAEVAIAVVADVDHLRLIEALLFASAEPLTVNAVRERMPEGADVGGLLMELQKTYEGRGVSLLNMDGYWAFRTASDLSDALSMKKDVQRKLSRAAVETLAIVAYHQPVTRPEIENIRGVAISNGALDVLMECGWVKPGRRRDTPGRPLTWVTTPAFLDHFGLTALNDLPGMDELKASGLLDSRPAIAVTTGNLFGAEDEMLANDLEDSDLPDDGDGDESVIEKVTEAVESLLDGDDSDAEDDSEDWGDMAASNDDADEDDDEEEVA